MSLLTFAFSYTHYFSLYFVLALCVYVGDAWNEKSWKENGQDAADGMKQRVCFKAMVMLGKSYLWF